MSKNLKEISISIIFSRYKEIDFNLESKILSFKECPVDIKNHLNYSTSKLRFKNIIKSDNIFNSLNDIRRVYQVVNCQIYKIYKINGFGNTLEFTIEINFKVPNTIKNKFIKEII